jgi:hypothetical protein
MKQCSIYIVYYGWHVVGVFDTLVGAVAFVNGPEGRKAMRIENSILNMERHIG